MNHTGNVCALNRASAIQSNSDKFLPQISQKWFSTRSHQCYTHTGWIFFLEKIPTCFRLSLRLTRNNHLPHTFSIFATAISTQLWNKISFTAIPENCFWDFRSPKCAFWPEIFKSVVIYSIRYRGLGKIFSALAFGSSSKLHFHQVLHRGEYIIYIYFRMFTYIFSPHDFCIASL